MMSVRSSVRLSVRLSLKISVTTEPIEFYSSGNIPTDPVVFIGYFLGGWDTPTPKKTKFFWQVLFLNCLLGQSP